MAVFESGCGDALRYRTWPDQSEVTARGSHVLPEDSATKIAAPLADGYGRHHGTRAQ